MKRTQNTEDSEPISPPQESRPLSNVEVIDTFVLVRSENGKSKALSKDEYERLQQRRRLLQGA